MSFTDDNHTYNAPPTQPPTTRRDSFTALQLQERGLGATLNLDPPASAPMGINPECGIPKMGSDGSLGNIANIVICAVSFLLVLGLIVMAHRRKAAVGTSLPPHFSHSQSQISLYLLLSCLEVTDDVTFSPYRPNRAPNLHDPLPHLSPPSTRHNRCSPRTRLDRAHGGDGRARSSSRDAVLVTAGQWPDSDADCGRWHSELVDCEYLLSVWLSPYFSLFSCFLFCVWTTCLNWGSPSFHLV